MYLCVPALHNQAKQQVTIAVFLRAFLTHDSRTRRLCSLRQARPTMVILTLAAAPNPFCKRNTKSDTLSHKEDNLTTNGGPKMHHRKQQYRVPKDIFPGTSRLRGSSATW